MQVVEASWVCGLSSPSSYALPCCTLSCDLITTPLLLLVSEFPKEEASVCLW